VEGTIFLSIHTQQIIWQERGDGEGGMFVFIVCSVRLVGDTEEYYHRLESRAEELKGHNQITVRES
jgi:hypothetical protein